MIGRWRYLFAQPGFAGLMVALGLLAINWPFLDLAREAGESVLFGYLFSLWGLLVLVAFLISRAVSGRVPDGEDDV